MNVQERDLTEYEAMMLRITGAQIRRIRQVLHMTQEELALKAGHDLTAKDIDSLENGQNDMFMVPFFDVCVALGVTPNDLTVERYADKPCRSSSHSGTRKSVRRR